MKLGLEELRAQRELVLKQLRWLESKIAGLEVDARAEEEPADPPPSPPPPGPQPAASPTFPLPVRPSVTPSPVAPPLPDGLRPQSASSIKRARFGCLFLFVAACALFLFLLFGLPYLLDSETTGTPENTPAEKSGFNDGKTTGTPFRP